MRIRNRGFTLSEALIAITVSLFIALSIWSVYIMGSTWWTQFMPRIEAQRIVRIAVRTIIYGLEDPGAGADSIGPGTPHSRRNGIAWATALPTIDSGSDDAMVRINYNLKGLSNQSFFMLKTEDPMRLYHNNTQSPVSGTTGLTGLSFELVDTNMVEVTAIVEKDVQAGGQPSYHVEEKLTQTVFLRNV
jgi:hypothetical protein